MADLTYSDSAASIRNNQWFRGRVETATSKYSNYNLNASEGADQAAKIAYGKQLAENSIMVVNALMFTLSGDAEVITAGPGITDALLQTVVEKTIAKLYPMPPVVPLAQRLGTSTGTPYPPPPQMQ
jgi:hypothetical protein